MKTPIAEKLAELRKAIGQIPPHKTPRQSFTPKQRAGVWSAYDGLCAGCEEPLQPGWQIDHIKEIDDGGAHEPSNWQPLCGKQQNGCHIGKTAAWRTRKAKADRIRKREEEGPKPAQIQSRNEWPKGRKLESRGFSPRKEKV